MPVVTMKSLMRMNGLPELADLSASFKDVFKQVLQANHGNLSNTRNLIVKAKAFEETRQYEHAALCYALAVNQKNKSACVKLLGLRRSLEEERASQLASSSEAEALNNHSLLSDLSFEFLEEQLAHMVKYDQLFNALVAKKSQLLIQLRQLDQRMMPVLQVLTKVVDACQPKLNLNLDLDLLEASKTLDKLSHKLLRLLPIYRDLLVDVLRRHLQELNKCQAANERNLQGLEAGIEKISRMEPVSIEASIKLFTEVAQLAAKTFAETRQDLLMSIVMTREVISSVKSESLHFFGGLRLVQKKAAIFSPPEKEAIDTALSALQVLEMKLNCLPIDASTISSCLTSYHYELDAIYYELKSVSVKLVGNERLQEIIRQLDKMVEVPAEKAVITCFKGNKMLS